MHHFRKVETAGSNPARGYKITISTILTKHNQKIKEKILENWEIAKEIY